MIHDDQPQFTQAWPPPDAASITAIVTKYDTRDGWVRVTWLPDGQVVVQGTPRLTSLVPVDRSWPSVLAWVEAFGFASVFTNNAPSTDAMDNRPFVNKSCPPCAHQT